MKKQNKNLKLNKAVVSGLSTEKVGEIMGGKTGAEAHCVSIFDFRPCFTHPCVATMGC